MKKLAFAFAAALACSAAARAADSPERALADIAPLAQTASPTLDCSAGDKLGERLKKQALQDAPAMQSGAMTPMGPRTVSNAQAQAMASLNDPEFMNCAMQIQQSPAQFWIAPLRDKLSAQLAAIESEKEQADNAWCQSHPSEACVGDPGSNKRFQAKAAAAGTQLLRDALAPYDQYRQQVAACVTRREQVVAKARTAGMGPQFDAMLMGYSQMDWSLAGSVAGANADLCAAARDAAHAYLTTP